VYLSKKTLGRGVHEALEELSLQLMDEASYREKELIIPPVGAN
jgi:hypothetical protein